MGVVPEIVTSGDLLDFFQSAFALLSETELCALLLGKTVPDSTLQLLLNLIKHSFPTMYKSINDFHKIKLQFDP